MRLWIFRGAMFALWLATVLNLALPVAAAPRPTPTVKACHICDEQEAAWATAAAQATPTANEQQPNEPPSTGLPTVAASSPVVRGVPQPIAMPLDAPVEAQASEPRSNGFALAIAVIAGMVVSLIYAGIRMVRSDGGEMSRFAKVGWNVLTPLLALVGLAVAGYLSYVETQLVQAVCGPVGDCHAVQSSPYARLFGVLPVGVLGAAGYVGILAAWLLNRSGRGPLAAQAPVAALAMALFGVMFSLYLTYLEPFVIRAVCIWCLTSAAVITLLMLLSVEPARHAFAPDDEDGQDEEEVVDDDPVAEPG